MKSLNAYIIPLSIVLAGALIAGAVIFSSSARTQVAQGNGSGGHGAQQPADTTNEVREITSADHIQGNLNAPVKIVEYSDFECPFCKRIHPTLQRVKDEYGDQVAWVFRHFPLDQLHPRNARRVAVVAECVNELAGNDAFWSFANAYFEATPSNDRTDLNAVIPPIISSLGIDTNALNACTTSGKYDQHVQDDIDNAIATGGRGTPWSIIVTPNGNTFPLSGAQPYGAVKQLIDLALQDT